MGLVAALASWFSGSRRPTGFRESVGAELAAEGGELVRDDEPVEVLPAGRLSGTLRRPDGTVACDRCVVADTAPARMRGLLGRDGLDAGEGLLIRPTNSVHMFFMRFAIDVVFLDRELRVLKIAQQLRPWRTAARWRAHSALELPAGECARLGLEVGDRLAWGSLEASDD